MEIVKDKLKSRKLWLAIVGALVPVINKEFGLNLDDNVVLGILGVIIAAIFSFAHVDGKKALATTNVTNVHHVSTTEKVPPSPAKEADRFRTL